MGFYGSLRWVFGVSVVCIRVIGVCVELGLVWLVILLVIIWMIVFVLGDVRSIIWLVLRFW